MALELFERDLVPELMIISSSTRTRETAELMIDDFVHYGHSPDLVVTEDLYHAPFEIWLELAAEIKDDSGTVLMMGHNPGIEELMAQISGQYVSMPTAAIAHVQSDQAWAAVDSWELIEVWRPKEI